MSTRDDACCGWRIMEDGISYGITDFPYRKSMALYIGEGNCVEPVAYFRSDKAAAKFAAVLRRLAVPLEGLGQ